MNGGPILRPGRHCRKTSRHRMDSHGDIASQTLKRLERAPTLSDRVVQGMLDLIASSALRPSDRLPSERDLGERFGVSRTVVPEAARSLAARGGPGRAVGQRGDGGAGVPGRPSHAVEAHQRILGRLRERDGAGAEAAMTEHLEESRAIWRDLAARTGPADGRWRSQSRCDSDH